MEQPDCHDNRPPLPRCDWCGKPFVPWRVKDADWNLLPLELRPLVLCLGDFVRLLIQHGGDPKQLSVSHEPWERMKAIWPIRLGRVVHVELKGDIRLARVVHILGVRRVILRLLGHGPNPGEIVACWDGETRHKMTGRPVLRAAGWRSNVASLSR